MPSSTFANRCFVCVAFALFQSGGAAADEVWKCAFTESRHHMRGRDFVFPDRSAFFLRIKPPIVDIVVSATATGETFIPISYSITENTPARLVGIAHFDLDGGLTSTGEISLDKHLGHVRQTGHISDNSHSEINTGACSKSSFDRLPSGKPGPPANANGHHPSLQPEIPMPKRPLVRKRPA